MAAAAAGDTVGPGGDVLEFREEFVHDHIVGEGLRLAAVLLRLFLGDGNAGLPEVMFHRALVADEAAELLAVRAAEGGGGVEHPLRRTDSLVGLAANAAGHQNVIVLAVIVRPQDAAAAGTFDLGVRRFQRKYGAGTHYLRTAFRADIAQSSHIVSHRGPPCMIDQIWISCAWGR